MFDDIIEKASVKELEDILKIAEDISDNNADDINNIIPVDVAMKFAEMVFDELEDQGIPITGPEIDKVSEIFMDLLFDKTAAKQNIEEKPPKELTEEEILKKQKSEQKKEEKRKKEEEKAAPLGSGLVVKSVKSVLDDLFLSQEQKNVEDRNVDKWEETSKDREAPPIDLSTVGGIVNLVKDWFGKFTARKQVIDSFPETTQAFTDEIQKDINILKEKPEKIVKNSDMMRRFYEIAVSFHEAYPSRRGDYTINIDSDRQDFVKNYARNQLANINDDYSSKIRKYTSEYKALQGFLNLKTDPPMDEKTRTKYEQRLEKIKNNVRLLSGLQNEINNYLVRKGLVIEKAFSGQDGGNVPSELLDKYIKDHLVPKEILIKLVELMNDRDASKKKYTYQRVRGVTESSTGQTPENLDIKLRERNKSIKSGRDPFIVKLKQLQQDDPKGIYIVRSPFRNDASMKAFYEKYLGVQEYSSHGGRDLRDTLNPQERDAYPQIKIKADDKGNIEYEGLTPESIVPIQTTLLQWRKRDYENASNDIKRHEKLVSFIDDNYNKLSSAIQEFESGMSSLEQKYKTMRKNIEEGSRGSIETAIIDPYIDNIKKFKIFITSGIEGATALSKEFYQEYNNSSGELNYGHRDIVRRVGDPRNPTYGDTLDARTFDDLVSKNPEQREGGYQDVVKGGGTSWVDMLYNMRSDIGTFLGKANKAKGMVSTTTPKLEVQPESASNFVEYHTLGMEQAEKDLADVTKALKNPNITPEEKKLYEEKRDNLIKVVEKQRKEKSVVEKGNKETPVKTPRLKEEELTLSQKNLMDYRKSRSDIEKLRNYMAVAENRILGLKKRKENGETTIRMNMGGGYMVDRDINEVINETTILLQGYVDKTSDLEAKLKSPEMVETEHSIAERSR